MNVSMVVAAHKQYEMPKGAVYIPVHAGAEGKKSIGFIGDNTGDNISSLNPLFCELTVLYWAWKNLDYDYLGLVHYRRYFKGNNKAKSKISSIITESEIKSLLQNTDIILPKKRYYYIETIYSHYAHTFSAKDLDITGQIIAKKYPEYKDAFDRVMRRRSGHMFNMFVMKKEYVDSYCSFLFDVLFELKNRLDISNYTDFQKRLFGRVSERLTDVWIETNNLKYVEVPVLNMEKVNWFKKGFSFLSAKFFNKKYEKSF